MGYDEAGVPAVERFWKRVDRSGPISEHRPDLGQCWNWTGYLSDGYGLIRVGGPKIGAHVFSYTLHVGPVPAGLELDHLCRNRACVNPTHLEAVTRRINGLRGIGPAAEHARQTDCIRGHALSGANLILRQDGRQCLTCQQERGRQYYEANREAILARVSQRYAARREEINAAKRAAYQARVRA